MRLTTVGMAAIVVIVAGLAVTWGFGGVDGFHKWNKGFRAADTPTEAMERFREAIQQRRYRWAASYCTHEYAGLLIKCDAPAGRLGQVIDDIQAYMRNRDLRTDRGVLLLHYLDPFPTNFKVNGTTRVVSDAEALGFFVAEPLLLKSANANLSGDANTLDGKMFQQALMPGELFSTKGVKLVKQSDGWKLHVVPSARQVTLAHYFLDHAPAYEAALGTFRRDMTNGRYDSPLAYEKEVVDALRQANGPTR